MAVLKWMLKLALLPLLLLLILVQWAGMGRKTSLPLRFFLPHFQLA